jgi:hypothetical protein
MRNSDDELERFKTTIKLHEYAASLGFAVDKKESSRRETVMRRAADKISIRKDTDGHYVYYSFRGEPGGTIIDFAMREKRGSLGEARKTLRIYMGTERSPSLPVFEELDPSPQFDREFVEKQYAAAKPLVWHGWLENERKLPKAFLTSPRFQGRIRIDARANVLFLHEDEEGLCGFEKRNRNFKGFADLGKKGLWLSNQTDQDRRLVVGESAIDGISYEVLHCDGKTRYASFAGALSLDYQPALIAAECHGMPPGSEIVCITHPDADGERYAEVIQECAGSLLFRVHRPSGVKDWNDVLTSEGGLHFLPAAL